MKTLLYIAKHYSLQDASDEISLEHFRKALRSVRFLDQKAMNNIYDFLKTDDLPKDCDTVHQISKNALEKVKEIKRVRKSQELSELLDKLESKGLSPLLGAITELCSEEELIAFVRNAYELHRPLLRAYEQNNISQISSYLKRLRKDAQKLCCNSFKKQLQDISLDEKNSITAFYRNLASFVKSMKNRRKIGTYGFDYLDVVEDLKQQLSSKLFGQERAIETVCDALIKSNHTRDVKRPMATFFFLGPPATGKTYLATQLQNELAGYDASKVFDMTQFTHEDSGGDLYGTGRMWGNTRQGQLTTFVRKHPRCIIVFDEFEKANTKVQANLLSVLSEGKLNDASGWCKDGKPYHKSRANDGSDDEQESCSEENIESSVDFTQTIVIFTSNLGREVYSNSRFTALHDADRFGMEKLLFDAISRETKIESGHTVGAILPEMLSRLKQGNIVLFNALHFDGLLSIATRAIKQELEAFENSYMLSFAMPDEDVVSALLLQFGPDFDVRSITAAIAAQLLDTITDHYRKTKHKFKTVTLSLDALPNDFKDDQESYINELGRRNQRVTYDYKLAVNENELHVSLKSPKQVKVPRAKDFDNDGGLAIEIPEISFEQIAGHKQTKRRLREVLSLLNNGNEIQRLGVSIPKGMLLYGPPGTGKTMLAKALAHEAKMPFVSTTAGALLEQGKIKKIFNLAREYAPSIVFIDELDSLKKRGSNVALDAVVNELLAAIDGFNTSLSDPVFVVAATNHIEAIDPALLRSGRIDLHMEISYLDRDARHYFLKRMLENSRFDNNIDIENLLTFTAGLSGADLQKIERESLLHCFRSDSKSVNEEMLIDQINTLRYGDVIEHESVTEALEMTAYHEAGHAVLIHLLIPHKKIEQITVVPRKRTLGFVSFANEAEFHANVTKEQIEYEIIALFAGREAQMKQFGSKGMDSGASTDLAQATRLAHWAVSELGMGKKLEHMSLKALHVKAENYFATQGEAAVSHLLQRLHERTQQLVLEYWIQIEAVALALLQHEVLEVKDLNKIIKEKK